MTMVEPEATTDGAQNGNALPGQDSGRIEDTLLNELLESLGRVADGDFGVRMRRREGRLGEVSTRFNEVVRQLENQSVAIHKISQVVGREGRTTERLSEEPLRATWLSNARAIN